jgi:SAM-dependent methyltransferase
MFELQPWVLQILADPIMKLPCKPEVFKETSGVLDARVFLKNTHGYSAWAEGQTEYEGQANNSNTSLTEYLAEIEGARDVYCHYQMSGRILDCGGGAGSVREYLAKDVEFVSTDPWLFAPIASSPMRKAAYSCLDRPLNFIGATAEFQPFIADCFDWVHMRSMLDHVQVVDLALLEARRVLKPGGRVLIGLYVDGGKSGIVAVDRRLKDWVKGGLELIGITRWKDHHIWHPTYKNLLKLIADNGFKIEDTYWQPQWKDMVCYVCARKPN